MKGTGSEGTTKSRFARRRAILGSLLWAALSWAFVTGCSRPADSAKDVVEAPAKTNRHRLTFINDWYPEAEHGGYFAAQLKGYWAELGLDVTIVAGGPNPDIEKKVALDENSLGIVRGDAVFIAAERGLPVIAVNSYFQHDPQGIMVREDSPVRTFADLEDRDLAMQIGNTWFSYLQSKYGLKKTRTRPVTGSVANFVADPNWITQAYPTCEPYYAGKAGVKARMIQISDSGFDPYRVIIANRKLVAEHPEIVKAFSIGAYKGWIEYCRDPLPIHEHILSVSPTMEAEGLKFSYRKMRELRLIEGDPAKGETLGEVKPERWEALHQLLLDHRLIKAPIDRTKVYTGAFAPSKVAVDPQLPPPAL
jgi:NitT/TauT family transport system substrate-binding protein